MCVAWWWRFVVCRPTTLPNGLFVREREGGEGRRGDLNPSSFFFPIVFLSFVCLTSFSSSFLVVSSSSFEFIECLRREEGTDGTDGRKGRRSFVCFVCYMLML